MMNSNSLNFCLIPKCSKCWQTQKLLGSTLENWLKNITVLSKLKIVTFLGCYDQRFGVDHHKGTSQKTQFSASFFYVLHQNLAKSCQKLKKLILTSVWCGQYPYIGRYIQQKVVFILMKGFKINSKTQKTLFHYFCIKCKICCLGTVSLGTSFLQSHK